MCMWRDVPAEIILLPWSNSKLIYKGAKEGGDFLDQNDSDFACYYVWI